MAERERQAEGVNLSLPWGKRLSLTWKQVGIALLAVGAVVLAIVFTVLGKWQAAYRLFLRLRLKQRQHQIDTLNAKADTHSSRVEREETLRADLEAERKKLERERAETKLEIEGMTHEEIADELRRLGY